MSRKVVVGVSRGVDSSVTAWLLREQSYDVTGIAMQVWQGEGTEVQEAEGGCCGPSVVDDARRITMDLGTPYYVMSFEEEFHKSMTDYFAGRYMGGRMPNPCIACNRHVKWEPLLRRNTVIGANYITTGHYAQINSLPGGRYSLKTSVTAAEDRVCTLYSLTQERLSHTLMPVGGYHKKEIWGMAKRLGLPVTHKPGSQEVRSVPDHDYASFIEEYMGGELPPGNLADLDGSVLGRRRDITHYTVDQRRGLNLSMSHPVFVVEICPETNEVVIGGNQDAFINVFRCDKLNWMAANGLHEKSMDVLVKIRYSHRGSLCIIRRIRYDMVERRSRGPVRTMTPGQAIIFYDGGYVTGGDIIIRRSER